MSDPVGTACSVRALRDDQRARWLLGERILAESYIAGFPEAFPDEDALLEFVLGEFCLRCELADAPSPEEYCRRFPKYVLQLRPLLEMHQATISRESSSTDESRQGTASPRSDVQLADAESDAQSTYLPSGSTLGDYMILDKLGEGGMGLVYRAEHCRMKRLVALKVLSPRISGYGNLAKRFQREVEAVSRLTHPNIVAAFDAREEAGITYFVMELIKGRDLTEIVRETGPLPVMDAVNYALQAAEGLAYAHGEGIVHRDIKPSNLLLDGQGVVKILDLGLARFDSGRGVEDRSVMTSPGVVLGTLDYLAPEQAINFGRVDGRADIYSLGCTLYFLLTGVPPYGGRDLIEKLLAHREHAIPSLVARRPDAPADLDRVLTRMLAKRPEHRPQSMSEVICELRRVSDSLQRSRGAAIGVLASKRRLLGVALTLAAAAMLLFVAYSGLIHRANSINTADDRPMTVSEHAAAQWVLDLGGTVRLRGMDREIRATDELPSGELQLSVINLDGNPRVTDNELRNLEKLVDRNASALYLILSHTAVTDKGLRFLPSQRLQWLDLEYTQITDVGLDALAIASALRLLRLEGTRVSAPAVARLAKRLPGCQIVWVRRPIPALPGT